MHGALLAGVHPVNAPHGANLTFAIPILFFVVVTAALFLRFRAPHSVPGHVSLKSSRWARSGESAAASFGEGGIDAAVGIRAEPDADAPDAPAAVPAEPGTVQSDTTAGDVTAAEHATPASDGTEDDE